VAKDFQCASPYGDAILEGACDAIITAPDGKQETTLSFRSFVVGRYVGGGLIERDTAINELVKAGLQMVNFDKRDLWTRGTIERKVTKRINKGIEQPLDGEEIFRAMEDVYRRFFADPQRQRDVEELLEAISAQKDEWADAGHCPDEEPPEAKQEAEAVQQAAPTEYKLIRRADKGAPPPVPFSVDRLFHEIGTGNLASKYWGGKTYVAMSLAASVATGKPFAGRAVLRRGAVLWLAAEGEWEVDLRVRAAVRVLGCDPDEQPIYVQKTSVPKLLSQGGEAAVMAIVNEAKQAARTEFGLPLVLVVFDTMIKSAGYKKSENDSLDVNNMIQAMEGIAIRAKCFALALDHMGKDEERGARGSSDKPSSVDVYMELRGRTLYAIKIKGGKGPEQIDFKIVDHVLEDGQETAAVTWGKWHKQSEGAKALNAMAKLLLDCARAVVEDKGEVRQLFYSEPPRRCAMKGEIYNEFRGRHKGERHDQAFRRAWDELAKNGFVSFKKNENDRRFTPIHFNDFVWLDKE
jgi:AAA domain